MIADTSPFSLARFEYEQEHMYFLQRRLFERLELQKPVYLVGSRGTGKTTLLKALSWSERLANKSLQRQLSGQDARYIGVYLKLPEIQLGLISRWATSVEQGTQANIFAHYIDLVWIEELLRAISEYAVAGRIDLPARDERECMLTIFGEYRSIFSLKDAPPQTLRELARSLRLRREDLEMCASTGVSPQDAVRQLRLLDHVGEFGRKIAEHLGRLCNQGAGSSADTPPWTFKVCMDEGECLDDFQQLVMNTMLRLSKAPLFFVVSFVSSPSDATTTLIHGLSLQQADRELVPLDDLTETEFRELVEGVASVRVQHLTGEPSCRFSASRILGSIDINALLLGILRESVSPDAKALLERAKTMALLPTFDEALDENAGRRTRNGVTAPPIYQTYLIDKLQLTPPDTNTNWKRRKQESAELRKKLVAAYLSICNDINAEPRYASAEILLQVSDKCVRDYLGQLHEIYQIAGMSLPKFLEGPIDVRTQDRAIKSASRKKYESLPLFGVNSPAETLAVVDGLSKLTSQLQKKSPTDRHLKSSERGLFVVNFGSPPVDGSGQLLRSVREAAEAGFLRVRNASTNPLVFRVHTSLSPKYGFSYRGAYYQTPLDWHFLDRLRRVKETSEIDSAVDEMYNSIEGVHPQDDLFSDETNA